MALSAVGALVQPTAQIAATFSMKQTAKEVIRDARNRVNQTVQGFVSGPILSAAGRMHSFINSVEAAYRNSLDHTLEEMDKFFFKALLELDSAVKELEARNYPKIQEILDRLQHIVNQLPGANPYPEVFSISPKCVVWPPVMDKVVLCIRGHFPQTGERGTAQVLSLNQNQYKPITHSGSEIWFVVPTNKIFSSKSSQLSVGKLTITQVTSKMLGLCTTKKNYQFHVPIGAIPPSPGSIVVELHKETCQRETKETTESVSLNSSEGAGGLDQEKTIPFEVTPGWKVLDCGPVPRENDKRKGHYELVCQSKSDTRVEYRAKTWYHKGDKDRCGQLRCTLSFKEYRDVNVAAPTEKIPVDLHWGAPPRIFSITTGAWKVIFTPFDGSPTCEFIKPEADNPFISVSFIGNRLKIEARHAKDVHFAKAIAAIPRVVTPILTAPSSSAASASKSGNTVQPNPASGKFRSKL